MFRGTCFTLETEMFPIVLLALPFAVRVAQGMLPRSRDLEAA